MSQVKMVLNMLRHAGSHGVHTADLRRAYCGDPARRVCDLREQGYVIEAKRERSPYGVSQGVRYFLRSEPPARPVVSGDAAFSPPPGAASPETTDTLFDVPKAPPYDPYEAA